MNVVIRTDASLEIGTGHVMRCITLANQLKEEGANVTFICRDFQGNSISYIQSEGFVTHALSKSGEKNHWKWIEDNWKTDAVDTKFIIQDSNQKIDLLIVDHYGLDAKWENQVRSTVGNIMVIDDLANRPHDCDMLLDQNFYTEIKSRYKGLVPHSCKLLLGPDYVLLREEFLSIDIQKIQRNGQVKNVLVFFGGTDPSGETVKTLEVINRHVFSDIVFNVIVGATNPLKDTIKEMCVEMKNVVLHCQVNNMAELMKNADIAIGAGGTTSWERCFLGLPSLVIVIADNQKEVTTAIAEKGAIVSLGENVGVTVNSLCQEMRNLCIDRERVKKMVRKSWEIVNPDIVKLKLVKKNIMELLK